MDRASRLSLLLIGFGARAVLAQEAPTAPLPPSIDVIAHAVVYVVPDKVEVSVSVEVFNARLAEARREHRWSQARR